MARSSRSNPLALAVLICLYERPMHPYEAAGVLRRRYKHESVRLNYGSLYAVVDSLERRGLIEAQETERSGRLPERTIYRLTDQGRAEIQDWLSELISVPTKEYPSFVAALSFLPALPPDTVIALLRERAISLEVELAAARGALEYVEKLGLPRLLWIESDFSLVLKETEIDYVHRLIEEITSGTLEGVEWWRQVRYESDRTLAPQLPWHEMLDGQAEAKRGEGEEEAS
ncbi:MAG: PadR family transcriptional regulator [Acidimicrobiaceae bacterium]|nr:PadR family transcriptional regulator [Acidimicrobiaceae bacterium]MBO0747000.1 PadR family transcriptional regulator [Acidimicrobiaceae bacterium]